MLYRLAEIAFGLYTAVLPLAQLAFAMSILILLPMAIFPRTRGQAGANMLLASYLFGFTVWTLGAAVTLSTYGWLALFIGIFLLGFGVVPIAIFAAFFTLEIPDLGWSLIVMALITTGYRFVGALLAASTETVQPAEYHLHT